MSSGKSEKASECKPARDFLRHIVNHVLSEMADKIPMSVFNEIRGRFAAAEEAYKFTKYGGNPERLRDYLESREFQDLVAYAQALNADWVIRRILEETAEEYREICLPVSEKAKEILESMKAAEKAEDKHKLSPDAVYRSLKMKGYKATLKDDGVIIVEGSNFTATIRVSESTITYTICREGKSGNIESVEAKMEKIREL